MSSEIKRDVLGVEIKEDQNFPSVEELSNIQACDPISKFVNEDLMINGKYWKHMSLEEKKEIIKIFLGKTFFDDVETEEDG